MAETKPYLGENVLTRKLRLYLKNNFNVLLIGKHGCGKTLTVKSLWENEGLKYRIYSAATMDPWVDFIGVPKEKTDEKGNSYLDLVRPREFADDEVEAIFMDEYNRAQNKVRSAVMELIQFKSINGKKFNKLRVVWAAINPDDGDDEDGSGYDVEKLDPAQRDRFQIQIEMPYKPDKQYFSYKYGADIAESSIGWWETIKDNKIKNKVSPRRLDYALEVFLANGDLDHVLPKESNPSKLKKILKETPALYQMKSYMDKNDIERAKTFICDENNYDFVISTIIKDINMIAFFVPLMPDEKISTLISQEVLVQSWALNEYEKYENVKDILRQIAEANLNKSLSNQIKRKTKVISNNSIKPISIESPCNSLAKFFDPFRNPKKEEKYLYNIVNTSTKPVEYFVPTANRKEVLTYICDNIPNHTEMKKDTIEVSLSLIDMIIGKSHSKMLDAWNLPIMEVINECLLSMMNLEKNGENIHSSEIFDKYVNIAEYVIARKEGFIFTLEQAS